jgi:two-component system CheB/CheR fusion protein
MAKKKARARKAPRRTTARRERGKPSAARVRTPAAADLTVVGIGASAGGLEALTRLLQPLDPKTSLALVVVQHLAAQHESLLPELLGASAAVPVVQVRNGMPLQAGRVHVIPPNVEMTVTGGVLRLTPRGEGRSRHHPIDAFFASLAERTEGRAIGIVLSGSASDGAIGLREIKSAGGITIAQAPKTAKYDGMPRAAIATGAVDLVLSPEQIAEELTRLDAHPFLKTALTGIEPEVALSDGELEVLFGLLRSATGVDFTHYKLPTIQRRLQRRMLLHRTERLKDYLAVLQKDPNEIKTLYRDLLIHVTRFFRDPESFQTLKRLVFPRIVAESSGKRPVRIWVPGCATGEEAYSVAIALIEHLGPESTGVPIQVFATDVSDEAIAHARLGLYPESIATDLSPERLRRFFTPIDSQFRISKIVRDSCIFARQDLTRDPPFSKLDLIVCRNVLIYLGPRLQRKLMDLFHYALKPAGFLMLGAIETVGGFSELFTLADKQHKIYSKRPAYRKLEPELVAHRDRHRTERDVGGLPPGRASAQRSADMQNEISRVLMARYTPPAVVVDEDFVIIQTRGKTGPFLELAGGEPTLNLLKMAREGLLHGLRSALLEARKTHKPVRREGLVVKTNGGSSETDVHVLPLRGDGQSHYLLVLFESPQRQRTEDHAQPARLTRKTKSTDRRVERLQHELTTSRDYLQSIIQDLGAANEELQSANEEILSSNEELQSTNEELDTAKEELQSTNEELNTVNDELSARNNELSHVNSDLINLLTAVPAAIVIVSSELRIRRFTPLAEQLLNLIPTDIGRPLSNIKPNLEPSDLEELTREVMETVTVKDLEARDRSGRLYSIRIRPYKDQGGRIDGAVLSFADLTRSARADTPEVWRDFVRSVIDAVGVAVMVLDNNLRVLLVNPSLTKLLGVRDKGLRHQLLTELDGGAWQQPALLAAIDRVRATGQSFSGIGVELSGHSRLMLSVDGQLMSRSDRSEASIVLTIQAAEPSPGAAS